MYHLFVNEPITATFLVFFAIMAGVMLERGRVWLVRREFRNRKPWRSKGRTGGTPGGRPDLTLIDGRDTSPEDMAVQQLKDVMGARFTRRALLNHKEMRVFTAIERLLSDANAGWRLMAQVSLGEILWSRDRAAFLAVNSKRVDLLLVDADGTPLHAIEYQGEGHYRGTAAARDAVKKEALRRAGIGYIEVVAGDRPQDLRLVISRLIEQHQAACYSAGGGKKNARK
ncbi:MAG: DUF2726 domain-containing protein [Sphingomonadaceae bacterium]